MPLALTVFGISQNGLDPALCYVLLRTVRGPGVYPRPTMPKDVRLDGISYPVLLDTTLELITWDKIITEVEEAGVQSAIDEGRLLLPPECPVCPGQTITGLPFGPVIAEEEFQIARISGVGLLYRKGIATEAPLNALKDALNKNLKPGIAPKAVEALVARIGAVSGIAEFFQKRRPLGGVDYFFIEHRRRLTSTDHSSMWSQRRSTPAPGPLCCGSICVDTQRRSITSLRCKLS
jgi:hypothetical protein